MYQFKDRFDFSESHYVIFLFTFMNVDRRRRRSGTINEKEERFRNYYGGSWYIYNVNQNLKWSENKLLLYDFIVFYLEYTTNLAIQ